MNDRQIKMVNDMIREFDSIKEELISDIEKDEKSENVFKILEDQFNPDEISEITDYIREYYDNLLQEIWNEENYDVSVV